jgi:hypothetical protein
MDFRHTHVTDRHAALSSRVEPIPFDSRKMSTQIDRFLRVAQLPDRIGGVKVVCVRQAKVRLELV